MLVCYILSVISLVLLCVAFAQAFFSFTFFNASALTVIILTSVVYFLNETLVIFFFVGTGASIKDYIKENNLNPEFYKKSFRLKMKLYPPLLLNMLLMILLFVAKGAVDTQHLPALIYQTGFIVCIAHFLYIKFLEHLCFKENTENMLVMSGVGA